MLDVRTGKTVSLPGSNSTWYRVGTRYVMGVDVLYNIATGVSTRLHRPADLDARGASMKALCPAVRHLVSRYQPKGFFASFAYQGDLFAQGYGTRGDVQIDRCHGRPTILRARGNDYGFVGGKPEYFDLRGGLLSWDTGSDATAYIERPFRGSIYVYELTSHRLRRWLLPRVTVRGGEGPITGTFGYSTHRERGLLDRVTNAFLRQALRCRKVGGLRRISEIDTPHAQSETGDNMGRAVWPEPDSC